MRRRVIPVLLIDKGSLVKTKKFKQPTYIGDPINSLKLFNDLEVDEAIIVDISASKKDVDPDYNLLTDLSSEAFMPLAYGGGVKNTAQMSKIFSLGFEKISLNHALITDLSLLEDGAKNFGSQSIIASIDIKKNLFGKKRIFDHTNKRTLKQDIVQRCKNFEEAGAGEIFINSVDYDGMLTGYDLDLLAEILSAVGIPVVICGGAKSLDCFASAASIGADSAAGSLFVFSGGDGGILVNYPSQQALDQVFNIGAETNDTA
jgi:cyclase